MNGRVLWLSQEYKANAALSPQFKEILVSNEKEREKQQRRKPYNNVEGKETHRARSLLQEPIHMKSEHRANKSTTIHFRAVVAYGRWDWLEEDGREISGAMEMFSVLSGG